MNALQEINSMVKEADPVDRAIWESIQPGLGDDKDARRRWLFREGDKYARMGKNGARYASLGSKPGVARLSFGLAMSNPLYSSNVQSDVAASRPNGTKFDFAGEAKKMLGELRSRYGTFENQMTRDFTRQWRDMQRNPGQYDDAKKRQILQQWKDRVAQFERGQSSTANDVRLSQNRQAVLAPNTRASLGTGWNGRQVVQGGSAPASRVQVATQSNPMAHNAVTGQGGQTLYRNAQGQNVALSELPSSKMQWWNQTKFDTSTPAGRNAYYASYLPGSMRTKPMAGVRPYVARNNGNGGDRPSKEMEEKTRQFGDA